MAWWRAGMCLLVAGLFLACAKQEPEPQSEYRISAERLGMRLPEGSLAAQLSPAERDALAGQGYEIELDREDWEAQAAADDAAVAAEVERENEGKFQRAMDHVGKATVAISMVAISVGMMIAPFFLM